MTLNPMRLVRRLANRYLGPLPDGATESDTKRDGAFSYAGESHPFTWGFSLALVTAIVSPISMQAAGTLITVQASLLAYAYTGKLAKAKAKTDMKKYVYRQIYREPHYFGGGIVGGYIGGGVLAGGLHLLSGGAYPSPVEVINTLGTIVPAML